MADQDFDSGYLQLLIGQLQGRVGALEEQNRQLLSAMAEINRNLTKVNETLNNATGGWRTLIGVGTVGAAVGGFVVAIIGLFRGGA